VGICLGCEKRTSKNGLEYGRKEGKHEIVQKGRKKGKGGVVQRVLAKVKGNGPHRWGKGGTNPRRQPPGGGRGVQSGVRGFVEESMPNGMGGGKRHERGRKS